MSEIIFVAENAPSLRTRINQTFVQFQNGTFKTNDKELEDKLREMLDPESGKFNSALARCVRVLDVEKASKVHEAHRKAEIARRGSIAGGTTSAAKNMAIAAGLKEREASVLALGSKANLDPQKVHEIFEKEHIALTTSDEPVSTPSEGFKPDPVSEKTAMFAENADVKPPENKEASSSMQKFLNKHKND